MSDLGLQIRDYYENVVERVDPMMPPVPFKPEPNYRPVFVLAATVLLVLVGIGVAPFLARWVAVEPAVDETTTTAASPTTTIQAEDVSPSTTLVVDDVPLAIFKHPLLVPFLELSACGSPDLLADWAAERMKAFGSPGAWSSVPIEDIASAIPIYRDDTITCLDGVQSTNGSMAWAGWDVEGNLVARAVSRDADANILEYIDYDAYEAAGAEYHQDFIGSGQAFTGWATDGGIEASVRTGGRFRHLIVEIPGYQLPAPDTVRKPVAAPLISKLTVNSIESPASGNFLRLTIPEGFAACVRSTRWGGISGFDAITEPIRGEVTTFCNLAGETFRVVHWDTQDDHPEPPPDPMPPDLPPELPEGRDVPLGDDLTYRAWEDSASGDSRWSAAVEVPYIGQWILIEATAAMTLDDITALLESSPWFNQTLVNPADGTNDLRDQYGAQWITDLLTAIGATHITEKPIRGLGRPDDAGPPPVEVAFRHQHLGTSVGNLFAYLYVGEAPSLVFVAAESASDNETLEIDGVTVSIGIGPEGAVYNATANCGGINITVSFDPENSSTQWPPPEIELDPIRRIAIQLIEAANC